MIQHHTSYHMDGQRATDEWMCTGWREREKENLNNGGKEAEKESKVEGV